VLPGSKLIVAPTTWTGIRAMALRHDEVMVASCYPAEPRGDAAVTRTAQPYQQPEGLMSPLLGADNTSEGRSSGWVVTRTR